MKRPMRWVFVCADCQRRFEARTRLVAEKSLQDHWLEKKCAGLKTAAPRTLSLFEGA